LLIGLVLGGAIGYALHGAVAPRMEGGAPTGPADIMAGAGAGSGMGGPATGMGGGAAAGGQAPQMPAEITMQVQKYRQILASDPSNLGANIGMGNLLFDSGQWERAVQHYTKALEKDPKNGDVRVDMAIAHHNLGQNDLAMTELKRVTQDLPQHLNAWLNLGVVSASVGDNATAVKAWERYLALDPNGSHAAAIRDEISRLKPGS
jgi:predicted Zn-dependent protease